MLVGVRKSYDINLPMNIIINCAVENNINDKLNKTLPTIMMVRNIRHYGIH